MEQRLPLEGHQLRFQRKLEQQKWLALVAFATLGNPLEKSTQRWLVQALFDWRQSSRFFIDAGQHDGS